MKNVYIPSPHTPPPPPTTSLRPRPHPHWREGETVKKRQETLSCYIITTPGIMCTLIKIHVFSPPPTLADHRERGDLLVYWRSPVGLSPGLGQERGVKEVAAGGGMKARVDGADGKRRGGVAGGNRWPACLVMVLVISGDLGRCLAGWISAVLH